MRVRVRVGVRDGALLGPDVGSRVRGACRPRPPRSRPWLTPGARPRPSTAPPSSATTSWAAACSCCATARSRAAASTASRTATTKAPVTEDTIFHWASITKTFTGIAILQLRDRGLLSLDDPIVKYLPELRQVRNPHGDMAQVTLRHLLSHSAGLPQPHLAVGRREGLGALRAPALRAARGHAALHPAPLRPGQPCSYSNPGIVFLGRTIEVLTNEDYEVYVDKNILRPLGMHRSFFDKTPPHLLAPSLPQLLLRREGAARGPLRLRQRASPSRTAG